MFGHFVCWRDHHDLDADIQLFFALTNALLDASIVAWDAKRAFDSERPLTAIHYLFKGVADDWQPYQLPTVVTPPFPKYISGHSIFSAAATGIIKRFTGSDTCGLSYTQTAGTSRVEPGVVPAKATTLTWTTFSEAADQAGLSRRYGGLHFEDGDLAGRAAGHRVAAQVWAKAQQYIQGVGS